MIRDVVCQLPPEAGHPPYIAARLKKLAYGMNDAPRRWWNILDKALRSYGMILHELTDASTCCIRHSRVNELGDTGHQGPWHSSTVKKMSSLDRASDQKWTLHVKKTLDPIAGSPATGKSVAGIIDLFVDDLFGAGGNKMEQRVLTRLRKDFQVGPEDWNDATFTGQRIRWTQAHQTGS